MASDQSGEPPASDVSARSHDGGKVRWRIAIALDAPGRAQRLNFSRKQNGRLPANSELTAMPGPGRRFQKGQSGNPSGRIEYSRDRQQPTRLCGILCPFGKPPHLPGRKVQPHRYRLTHGKRSSGCHLESLGRRFRNPSKSQSLSRLVSGDLYADLRSDRFNSPRA
jgi:hypothetical protein